jgi:exosome complex RNA-binding protein Rrp4
MQDEKKAIDEIITPGHYLGTEKQYQSGEGTYALDGKIYSSLVGVCKLTKKDNEKVCNPSFFLLTR